MSDSRAANHQPTDPTPDARRWPEPYLQPDRNVDCGFYAVAYAARCLGFHDVTAQQVKDWRAGTNRHEEWFITAALDGPDMLRFSKYLDQPDERRKFWLGPEQRDWFTGWLGAHVALMNVYRIPTIGHAVVALEAREEGVLIMDPIYGYIVEPWDWLLGSGAGNHGCHFASVFWPLASWEKVPSD